MPDELPIRTCRYNARRPSLVPTGSAFSSQTPSNGTVNAFKSLSRNIQYAIVGGGLLALVVLLPVAAFAVDEVRANGEVARNVTAAGIDLGGLGEVDAITALRTYETDLATKELTYLVAESSFAVTPRDLGLDIDEDAILAVAMQQRREKGFVGRLFGWFGSFGDERQLEVTVAVEPDRLDELLDTWEEVAVNNPAHEGGLIVEDGIVLPDYPRPGAGIDRDAAQGKTRRAVQTLARSPISLTTLEIEPVITQSQIDDAVERANRMIDGPITLRANDPELEIEFPADVLASALLSEVTATAPARVDITFDRRPIGGVVRPLRDLIEQPARDAEFLIDEHDVVTLRPSRAETLLDVDLVVDKLFDVADRGGSSGTFPFEQGDQAAFTTEAAEAMGEITMVSSFTTEHPCCQDRVNNIQTMAKAVDGSIVEPGEEFDLNGRVGQRTVEKGYVPAPMILSGEIVDDVGGGVSQFATTIYNAMFFGCYEDVTHRAHSYYFSRYPEGREATVSWGGPELTFRNNTDALLIVKTAFTSRSITVKMFGNIGGKECTAGLGERYRYTDPPIQYEGDETVPPGQEIQDQTGSRGWSIDIFRYVTDADGNVDTDVWSHRYLPWPTIIRVNPCDLEDATDPCPVQVPDVVGRKVAVAIERLEARGFVVSQQTVETDDESLDGRVITQSPSQGSLVEEGSTVVIEVGQYVEPAG